MILFRRLEIRVLPAAHGQADPSHGPAATGTLAALGHDAVPAWLRGLAGELITVADQLADLAGTAAEADTARTHRRIESVLSLCGIARIADDGPIDFLRHEVVGDRPAPEPGLVDHIAATVRPGYHLAGELLRAQQVIGYVDSGS